MKRKMDRALACLSIILLTSSTLIVLTSAPNGGPENYRYIVMGGTVTTCTQTGGFATVWTVVTYKPLLLTQNITFSDPDPTTGVVNLTVPAASYVGIEHSWYDEVSGFWYRISTSMAEDGYGWLFTGPLQGDVDVLTFSNNTGVYFFGPDGLNGTADDSSAGPPPQVGVDGVPGTADDDFGDGTPDPVGSSILYLPTTLRVEYWAGLDWAPFFVVPWPQIMTTAVAYDIVVEPESRINGANSTEEGEPWEFIAGLDHPGDDGIPHTGDPNEYEVDYGHSKWNAYVTYVCSWSVLEIGTFLGPVDVFFEVVEKKVREDCVIADVKGDDEEVRIFDVRKAAKAYLTYDEGPGEDGTPGTADDHLVADALFDAAVDMRDPRGYINIFDIRRVAKDYGKKLTPDCIVKS